MTAVRMTDRNDFELLREYAEHGSQPAFGELVFIPDAGHWVQYEAADAFNAALLRLLA